MQKNEEKRTHLPTFLSLLISILKAFITSLCNCKISRECQLMSAILNSTIGQKVGEGKKRRYNLFTSINELPNQEQQTTFSDVLKLLRKRRASCYEQKPANLGIKILIVGHCYLSSRC